MSPSQPFRNQVGLSQERLDLLLELFAGLKKFGGELHDCVLRYVLDDGDECVLDDLAAPPDAADALKLRCTGHFFGYGNELSRATFLQTLDPVDCRFYLRLGKVFESLGQKPACKPLLLDALL